MKYQSQCRRHFTTSEDQHRISEYYNRRSKTILQIEEIRLGLPQSFIQRFLPIRLHLLLYRLQIVHEPEGLDYEARNTFSVWCIEHIELDASLLNLAFYYDERDPHVNGKQQSSDVEIRGSEYLPEMREMSRDIEKRLGRFGS